MTCRFDGCSKTVLARGLCAGHYSQDRQGLPLAPLRLRNATPYDRVMSRVERVGDCLVWQGGCNDSGHGLIGLAGNTTTTCHRVVWEHHHGLIPDGLIVHHSCENPPCVEIDHLHLRTRKAHVLEDHEGQSPPSINARKTHCIHGHSLEDAIVRERGRECRTCYKERLAAQREERPPRTHCRNGHPRTPENSILNADGSYRRCRTCMQARRADRRCRSRDRHEDPGPVGSRISVSAGRST